MTKTFAEVPMTPDRKRKLAALAARPDSEIDLSDIPELTDSFFKNATKNPYYQAPANQAPGKRLSRRAPNFIDKIVV